MKRTLLALAALFAAGIHGTAAASFMFTAMLTGDQEVPDPVVTSASGTASLELNTAQTRLEILITLVGLDLGGMQTPGVASDDVIGAHIHAAPAGMNGDVVFGFISPDSDENGDLAIDPVAGTIFSAWDAGEGNAGATLASGLPALFNEGLYFNVHTVANGGGEIRGQILRVVPEPATLLLAGLGLTLLGAARLRRR